MNSNDIKCCGGNRAQTVCFVMSCTSQKGAYMCQTKQCCCQSHHQSCIMIFSLDRLIKALQQKGKTYLPVLNQLLNFYDSVVKSVTIQKQKLINIIENCPMTLQNDEKSLYQKIKYSELIMPQQIARVLQTIMISPTTKILTNRLEECKAQIQQMTKNIESIFKRVEYFSSSNSDKKQNTLQNENNLCVSDLIVKPNRQKMQQKLQLTYLIKSLHNYGYINNKAEPIFGLLFFKPLLTLRKQYYQCFKFKIKHLTRGLSITFGISKQQQNNIIDLRNADHGCYLLSTSGMRYTNKQECKQSTLSFTTNQIIRVDYDPLNKRVVFIKNKQTQIIKINQNDNNNFYLCVGLQYPPDEVQFLGECDQYDM